MVLRENMPEHNQRSQKVIQINEKDKIYLQFENITCKHKIFLWNKFRFEKKVILNGVSGSFKPGELSGIIGPSGAGKTTLLNILAGFSTIGAKGEIKVNGVSVSASQSNGRGDAKYIRQENDLRLSLTVFESMYFAAALKLPHLSSEERYKKITTILNDLNIIAAKETMSSMISDGQKRRLAVGIELISEPSLLFLDEPTSGLDSSSSTSLILMLRNLAKGGRTIITTIHQPSALILEKFDAIFCLGNGRTLYNGPQINIIPAFQCSNLHCPSYHNPADFLIELASAEDLQVLNKAAENFLEYNSRYSFNNTEITCELNSTTINNPPSVAEDRNPSFYLYQTWILTYRAYLIWTRNYTMLFLRTAAYIVTAFLIGKVYYMSGKDASTIIGSASAIYSCVIFISYAAHMYVTLSLPMEIQFLKVEYFNRWYNLAPYITSFFILELPFQVIMTTLFAITTFWQTGNPIELNRVVLYFTAMIFVSICAHSWGFFLGSTTSTKTAVFVGPLIISTYSIFGFSLPLRDLPYMIRWLYHISYFRAGCHLAITALYGLNRQKLNCSKVYCHYVMPKQFLEEFDLDSVNITMNLCLILGSAFILYVMTFIYLYFRLNKR